MGDQILNFLSPTDKNYSHLRVGEWLFATLQTTEKPFFGKESTKLTYNSKVGNVGFTYSKNSKHDALSKTLKNARIWLSSTATKKRGLYFYESP